MVDGPDEETQAIRLTLTTNTNEFFLNIFHGLAYEYLLVKNFDEERARIEVLAAINQDPRVRDVLELTFDFDRANRKLSINFKVLMDSGNVSEGEVII